MGFDRQTRLGSETPATHFYIIFDEVACWNACPYFLDAFHTILQNRIQCPCLHTDWGAPTKRRWSRNYINKAATTPCKHIRSHNSQMAYKSPSNKFGELSESILSCAGHAKSIVFSLSHGQTSRNSETNIHVNGLPKCSIISRLQNKHKLMVKLAEDYRVTK